jgi:hypothetical protein
MMRLVLYFLGFAVLGTGSALAFEQVQGGGTPPAAETAPAPHFEAPSPDSGKSGLALTIPDAAGKSGGTEVRIPGFGKVGILPKLDFGLELLYGASEEQKVFPEEKLDPNADLQIRGTIKHRW